MVEVEKRIRVYKDDKVVEAVALFDTGLEEAISVRILPRKLAMSSKKA
jgi:hypothetical protein